jgi:pimeloyl-ACP methyl ester carboxylesterase
MSDTQSVSDVWKENIHQIAGTELAVIQGGQGRPLLVLHEELGHPGWLRWHDELAKNRSLIIPIQPGLGHSHKVDYVRNMHELGLFYSRVLREMNLAPIDVIGFSTGGWTAAEMAVADSRQFNKMVLVAPAGIKPPEGEIMDVFTVTARTQLRASVLDPDSTPEFAALYGEPGPVQFEAFEEARAENARLAWEPLLFNRSLPHFLEGVRDLPVQIIWGRQDRVVPVSAAEAYKQALRNTDVRLTVFDNCGHRPEIEKPAEFINLVREFLA